MWEFLELIIERLSETFRWFLMGYFGTFALLIILYKNKLLSNKSPIGFIKKISYYLFLPLYIAIISWFLSATLIVEKDAKQMATYTLTKAEDSTLTLFLKEAVSYSSEWVGGKIETKEELVTYYLDKNGFKPDDYSTQVVEWTLNSGLTYIQNQAIKKGTIKIGDESVNFPLLIQDYLDDSEGITSMPFSYLKGMTFSVINSYTRQLYWIYGFLFFMVILILGLDILLKLKGNKKVKEASLLNPESTLENNQKKIDNSQKWIEK